jgi:hypothetical protein
MLPAMIRMVYGDRDHRAARRRPGSGPTAQESAQIAADPLLSEAYTKDRAATLALLRTTRRSLTGLAIVNLWNSTGGLRWSSAIPAVAPGACSIPPATMWR